MKALKIHERTRLRHIKASVNMNKSWVFQELTKSLSHWDQLLVHSLAQQVNDATKRGDIDEIIENYLPGETAAIDAINTFWERNILASGGLSKYQKSIAQDSAVSQSNKAAADGMRIPAAGPADNSSSGRQQPEKVLGMFKQGGRLRPSSQAVSSGSSQAQKNLTAANLEKKVLNCLGCGKIYDCRAVTTDITRFLERDGVCTFCGDKVPLTQQERQEQLQQVSSTNASCEDGQDVKDGHENDQASGRSKAAVAAEAAHAFKDRLIEYDRESAKRTTVIDDQSDYFEIDSNAWLTDEERKLLRQRRRMEEEAEAAKKKRMTVTIDLMGRKVIVPESSVPAASFTLSSDKIASSAQPSASSSSTHDDSARTSVASYLLPPKASLEEMARAVSSLRDMKITINPNINGPAPTLVPRGGAKRAITGGNSISSIPAAAAKHDLGVASTKARRQATRVQGDLFEQFDEFGLEVLQDEAAAWSMAHPFDLCPPELKPAENERALSLAKRLQAKHLVVEHSSQDHENNLPPGMTLLRGFLSIQRQAELVNMIRELGLGPGGFYTPSYKEGGQLRLKMMCLGLHWEPRSHSYEHVRSAYDGAVPPSIPPILLDLAQEVLLACEAKSGFKQPGPYRPDACLANFYEKTGRLGYHQDKDESAESLHKGLPVVSISIGDSADFLFGMTPQETVAQCVALHSGDVVIFGGPSRMIYHSVPHIYPGTAPSELHSITGIRPGRLNLTMRQV
ncbi:hypothetical protein CEUSTIGMA_g7094.t1 [Chlamydomonas eustigma]|uniref:Fe2OG dioxygenase domain-containing protein n=1 Tax=Chlamydomonas eustigma TaxID=1157962 RepID=A0A250X992_9CHLO|nr:hypothetical protein CEUSTIGMA_g7094.t1 [Chlamydomonas eustigma]|eukprot:GAX79653.1 hypothetical protein CEUSTIGMA_g7094.t1 [Chlamydomonas eustigma]